MKAKCDCLEAESGRTNSRALSTKIIFVFVLNFQTRHFFLICAAVLSAVVTRICINPKGLEGSLSQEVKKRSKNHLHLWRLEMSTSHQHPK